LNHHKHAGSPQDPDLDLVEGFPVSKQSLRRKLFRDLIGLTGIKRLYGILLMDLGYIEYTVSSRVVPIPAGQRNLRNILTSAFSHLSGKIIAQLVLLALLWAWGHPELYLLWVAAYLTTFSLFIRIRSIAEHACTQMDRNPLKNTRTTYATWMGRITVAPHRVNYHLEHHLLMTVPYFQLPRLHRILKDRGFLQDAYVAKNYWEVLKTAIQTSP
jgi:fatty acid desaturase